MKQTRDLGVLVAALAGVLSAQAQTQAKLVSHRPEAVSGYREVYRGETSRAESLRALVDSIEPKRAEVLNKEGKGAEAVAYLQPTVTEILKLYDVKQLPKVLDERRRGMLAWAFNEMGLGFAQQKKTAFAETQYLRGIKVFSENTRLHNNLGALYLAQGQTALAIRELQTAVDLDPAYARAQYNLGGALGRARQWAASIAAFGKAKDLGYKVGNCERNIAALSSRLR